MTVPLERRAARVLLVDEAGRVLLQNCCDPADPAAGSWWNTMGGGIDPGETPEQAAVREVHEETGWHVDPASVTPLGFLHLRHGAPPPEGYRFPHPDFLQVVVAATASHRDPGPDGGGDAWTDLDDGFEQVSRLVGVADLDGYALTPAEPVFVAGRPEP